MIAKRIKHIFDPFIELDIQVWENFEKLGEVKTFSKASILKASNTTEKNINIVIEGSGGNLIWRKNNFVCIDISFENDFLNDYMSFALQKSTPIEVRLFEDSTVFQISYPNFRQIFADGNFGELVTKLVLESSFISKQQQQIDLLTKTAKERYAELLENKESIERTPLKYLASYLGITPQSLSRIRAEQLDSLP
mgnify:CR=1 FL=1